MQVVENGSNIREVHPMHTIGRQFTERPYPYITTNVEDQDMKK